MPPEKHECLNPELIQDMKDAIARHETRLQEGELRFQELMSLCRDTNSKLSGQTDQLATFNKRMFVDNGTTSFQTRLDRHDALMKGVLWVAGVTGGAVVTIIVGAVVAHFKAHGG